MMCSEISGLKLDQRSLEGLEEIKRRKKIADGLHFWLLGSIWVVLLADIRTGLGNPGDIAYNITQFEWEHWRNAMKAIGPIHRRVIQKIAEEQQLDHTDPKQSLFWEQIKHGCNP